MINIICLWQAYKRKQIIEVKWINREANLADAIIKGKPYAALTRLININQIDLQAVEWVEYTDISIGGQIREQIEICYKYSIACSLVFFKVALVLVNIRFIYHVHEVRNLRKTRIYTINTALKKN